MVTIHVIFKLLLGYLGYIASACRKKWPDVENRNLSPPLQDAILMKIAETHVKAAPASS